jgi:hypothetical protein
MRPTSADLKGLWLHAFEKVSAQIQTNRCAPQVVVNESAGTPKIANLFLASSKSLHSATARQGIDPPAHRSVNAFGVGHERFAVFYFHDHAGL